MSLMFAVRGMLLTVAGSIAVSISATAQADSTAAKGPGTTTSVTGRNLSSAPGTVAYINRSTHPHESTQQLPFLESNTPRISVDGRVMFFNSTRYAGRTWASSKGKNYDSDICYSVSRPGPDGRMRWSEAVNLGTTINTANDESIEAISAGGDVLYFSSIASGWVHNGGPFYRAELVGGKWGNVRGMGGGITDFFLSEPGRFKVYGSAVNVHSDEFYFATTAHSPTGEHQIWVAHFREGQWSYPENLGPVVNMAGGSFAPFIAADCRTLYFSSGRAGGYGGDDVYVTMLRNGVWTTPENLGPGINTVEDEAFFSLPASGDLAYMTRTAVDGAARIVSAEMNPRFLPEGVLLLTGTVVDAGTRGPVSATMTIENLATGHLMQRALGDGNSFAVVLEAGTTYGISVSAEDYGFVSTTYTMPARSASREIRKDFALARIRRGTTFALNNIFFDYNSDTIRVESHSELNRLTSLLKEHAALQIMITGHTDDIGSDAYNTPLSRRRAEAVRLYLIEMGGIAASRLQTKGFGSRKPMAPNTSESGREKNRAVEFVIL